VLREESKPGPATNNMEVTMPLYEVAVLTKPSKNDQDNGIQQSIIMLPKAVVASDEKAAAVKATAGISVNQTDDIEVLVRPFVGK
jgi:hypothetical protein